MEYQRVLKRLESAKSFVFNLPANIIKSPVALYSRINSFVRSVFVKRIHGNKSSETELVSPLDVETRCSTAFDTPKAS
jgi:hypothetical protein